MTPERWVQVKEVLGAALGKPEAERRGFLDQSCGSQSWLRQEVERLLAAHDSSSLQSPVAEILNPPVAPELTPGQMLGHYRVESKLGAGGMGVVYQAWDEQLRRPVALKVLSTRHFDESGGRQRFLREARAASALNHPNVVTIHDIGSDGGVDFIAMEYVEGQSLDRLIPATGLPVDMAFDYAAQIAGALAKAHAAGIVHRDLKPANIMVTGDGVVKLLDFGLARQVNLSEVETASLTQEGAIVGTPAYMSPEQAEGRKADERSDIFSFGAILYEMLSGRRAFAGNSAAAILSAVLKDEPAPLTGLPAEVQRIISLCLRKEPAERLRHIDDVQLLVSEFRRSRQEQREKPKHRVNPVRLSALAAAAVCAGFALWYSIQLRKPAAPEMRVIALTSMPGIENYPSFSPDGNQVAFVWNGQLYAMVVNSAADPLQFTSDQPGVVHPVWSPDGRQIAFIRRDGLYLVSALGGPERRIATHRLTATINRLTNTISWSPDGKWLAAGEGTPEGPWQISLVSADRDERRTLASGTTVYQAPTFSPDGRSLAYVSCPHALSSACDIHLLELTADSSAKGPPRRLTHVRSYMLGLAWTPDSRSLVYAASRCPTGLSSLFRVQASGSASPERLDAAGIGVSFPTISRANGRLAYVRSVEDSDIWRYQIGSAAAEKLISSTMDEHNAQYSPDGNRIAFVSNRSGECPEIWVSEQDGTRAMQLTRETGTWQGTPRWSPDGKWIAFDRSADDGHVDICTMDAGGGRLRRLTPEQSDESVPSWSRDGRWVYFRSNRTGRNEIWQAPFQGGDAVQMTTQGGYVAFESYDGKTLYYMKSPRNGPLFGMLLSGGAERQIISETIYSRAFYPVQDGIYFLGSAEGRGPQLKFFSTVTGAVQALTAITEATNLGLSVSQDHKSVLFSTRRMTADLMLIENFR